MAVNLYEQHRPREATITVSRTPDFSGDFVGESVAADDVEIQAAMDYLDAVSATWKAKIVLIGDFTISAALAFPSYIIFELHGSITLANGADTRMVTATSKTQIEILGGEWDGNRATQTAPNLYAFFFDTCSHLLIRDIYLHDSYASGPRIQECSDAHIDHCIIGDNEGTAVAIVGTSHSAVSHCHLYDSSGGIYCFASGVLRTEYNRFVFNEIHGHQSDGISLYPTDATTFCNYNVVHGNILWDNTQDETHVHIKVGDEGQCNFNEISNNIMLETGATTYGGGIMLFDDCYGNSIIGNVIYNVYEDAIYVGMAGDPSLQNVISDNLIYITRANPSYGIRIANGSYNTLNDNRIYNAFTAAIICSAGASYNDFNDNHIDTTTTGISVAGGTEVGNSFFGTRFHNVTNELLDSGTDTIIPSVSFPLVNGTTLIVTAGQAWGWDIDADTEYAVVWGKLPMNLSYVRNINIWAVGRAAPGGGNYMRAQFTGEAGASDASFTSERIDVVDHNNEEVDFAVSDLIHFRLESGDDADIGHLNGGDSFQFMVLHEGAGGTDIETDAVFRCVDFEYV